MVKKLWKWIIFRIWLIEMDNMWYFMGGCCFGLFPPSFSYTHSEEEADRIREEELKLVDNYLEWYKTWVCQGMEHSGSCR